MGIDIQLIRRKGGPGTPHLRQVSGGMCPSLVKFGSILDSGCHKLLQEVHCLQRPAGGSLCRANDHFLMYLFTLGERKFPSLFCIVCGDVAPLWSLHVVRQGWYQSIQVKGMHFLHNIRMCWRKSGIIAGGEPDKYSSKRKLSGKDPVSLSNHIHLVP